MESSAWELGVAGVHESHLTHLWRLRRQYVSEQRALTARLQELRLELEHHQHQRRIARLWGNPSSSKYELECDLLEAEQDEVATELAHVRLAVLGVSNEIGNSGDEAALQVPA